MFTFLDAESEQTSGNPIHLIAQSTVGKAHSQSSFRIVIDDCVIVWENCCLLIN
jgi:hypothetical protein